MKSSCKYNQYIKLLTTSHFLAKKIKICTRGGGIVNGWIISKVCQ